MIGKTLRNYRITDKLGVGGQGAVYKATDTKLGRPVVIKVIPPELSAKESNLKRFEREARLASSLDHPNICTIFDLDEQDGMHFIAMQYVEGKNVRQLVAGRPLELKTAVLIGVQVADALAAAHSRGIIHRDIKSGNVMVTPSGQVKVLDFGLAKLVDEAQAGGSGIHRTELTEFGVPYGTATYAAPEQARGDRVDKRADIFSTGVLLYEMLTGSWPFRGKTSIDVRHAVLHDSPKPLAEMRTGLPAQLQAILDRALAKDPGDRYQKIDDFRADLRSVLQEISAAEPAGQASLNVAPEPPRFIGRADTSVEYVVSEIKRHKRAVGVTLAVILIATTAGLFSYYHRTQALTEKDTILLADFVNNTGDAVFDGTLKQGLAVQLGQSPFLNLFADARVRQTLRLMGRSPDERVSVDVAREICQRQGVNALITGSIASLGSHYVLTLEAVNSQSGEALAREQGEAASKEDVLKTLSEIAIKLREKLGESLTSLQRFDAPLEVTTSSLEALKAYTLASEQASAGKWVESMEHYKHALELDPNFASAYSGLSVVYANTGQPKLAAENAAKAYPLRDRVSEIEKFRISSFYYFYVTGELDKYIEVLELYKKTYPRDERPFINLSVSYDRIGQWEKSAAEAGEAIRLNPNTVAPHSNLARAFMRLNRYDESLAVLDRAINQLKLDSEPVRIFVFQNAFIRGDEATMKQEIDRLAGKQNEYVALDWQANSAAFGGRWQQAQEFSRRAIDLAGSNNAKEVAAQYAGEAALRA